MTSMAHIFFREESPRPTKRRYSGPTMEQTPRPLPLELQMPFPAAAAAIKPRVRLLPKTPAAPRPNVGTPLPMPRLDQCRPEIFLPSEDLLPDTPPNDGTPRRPMRLKPRPLTASSKPKRELEQQLPEVQAPVHANPKKLNRRSSMPLKSSSSTKTSRSFKRRPSLPVSLANITQAKSLERSKAVPAPRRSNLKQSRSCHALCA